MVEPASPNPMKPMDGINARRDRTVALVPKAGRGRGVSPNASATNVMVIVPAIHQEIRRDAAANRHVHPPSAYVPPVSAIAPTRGLSTPPIRPTATVVPTPVPRIAVGYTFAASAYIVVSASR